jgi:sortase A
VLFRPERGRACPRFGPTVLGYGVRLLMISSRIAPAALAGVVAALVVGCGGAAAEERPGSSAVAAPASAPAQTAAAPPPSATPTPTPTPEPRTETASLSVPAIGLDDLRVVPYEGTTDDWPGTRIQNRGVAASPYGENGGVGPGEVGNYLVTAHRLSAGGPLRDLPSLERGESVFVRAGGTVYEYVITETRQTSFRSERSLAEQRAAVPGSPGERPTKAMITVSTCATPEDDAAGNFWRDDKGNPEHRIDKIGVLREVSPQ